jgi:putative SOS response-associated peptidase YedK
MHLYRLDATAEIAAQALGADAGRDPWAGGYVTPGRPAPVVVGDGSAQSRPWLRPKLWGVPPPRGDQPVTTVRNLSSPFWIGTLRHPELRCLIPATRFALWSGTAGARQQLWAAPAEPNRLLSHHGAQAMPVILRPGDYARWLTADWRDAAGLARPFPGQEMTLAEDPMV